MNSMHVAQGKSRRREYGRAGKAVFLLTGLGFDFRITMLKPNTYDGLLFVTAEGPPNTACCVWGPKERDGPLDCKHREDRVLRF